MSRRDSREAALKLLYQFEFQKQDFDDQVRTFISDQELKINELEYFNLLSFGVTQKKEELDGVYSKFLKNWNISRISRIDKTILRIASYEILYVDLVPFNVTVNEAVLLAKKYSTTEAKSFINGILGNMEYLKPANDTGKL